MIFYWSQVKCDKKFNFTNNDRVCFSLMSAVRNEYCVYYLGFSCFVLYDHLVEMLDRFTDDVLKQDRLQEIFNTR